MPFDLDQFIIGVLDTTDLEDPRTIALDAAPHVPAPHLYDAFVEALSYRIALVQAATRGGGDAPDEILKRFGY